MYSEGDRGRLKKRSLNVEREGFTVFLLAGVL
jgi:hypothetical protein